MDHLGAVLDGNLDDLIAGEIGANRGVLPALANDVCLIGLCSPLLSVPETDTTARRPAGPRRGKIAHTLPVHRETVLIAVNRVSQFSEWLRMDRILRRNLPEDGNCV